MSILRSLGLAALITLVLLALTDVVTRAAFPSPERVSSNFSSALLQLEMDRLRSRPPQTVFLGDSVLWGYKVAPERTATAQLFARGLDGVNLAYEGGSPINTYAMLRLLLANGVRPKLVVFNVNQKQFNPFDSAYKTIHPSVAALAEPMLSSDDRALLKDAPISSTFDAHLDRAISHVWELYALRADLREMLFGDVDAAHALDDIVQRASGAQARTDAEHVPTPDKFDSTYELEPLSPDNVSVHFLDEIATLLASEHIPALALLTPTNHALLHEYIDVPAYTTNLAYVTARLAKSHVRVVDLDRAIPTAEFIDNDHLTPAGHERLVRLLAPQLGVTGVADTNASTATR